MVGGAARRAVAVSFPQEGLECMFLHGGTAESYACASAATHTNALEQPKR